MFNTFPDKNASIESKHIYKCLYLPIVARPNGGFRGWAVFGGWKCPFPMMKGEREWRISRPKWPVLLVENQAAYVTCRPPSRGPVVVLFQCPDAPVGWWVCLPQGPTGAYAVNSPGGQPTLPPSALGILHAGTFHAV